MSASILYNAILLGAGKGRKTLATKLGHKGIKTALIERSAEIIGGSCINLACIPTKTFVTSALYSGSKERTNKIDTQTTEIKNEL
jgi:pyruvate/2-oxoglutarate dehydrogenase complex dihydrolipoamide dehydrogenase (E3) component